jgi:hypothetical protein
MQEVKSKVSMKYVFWYCHSLQLIKIPKREDSIRVTKAKIKVEN